MRKLERSDALRLMVANLMNDKPPSTKDIEGVLSKVLDTSSIGKIQDWP